jgi:hypothetical protein
VTTPEADEQDQTRRLEAPPEGYSYAEPTVEEPAYYPGQTQPYAPPPAAAYQPEPAPPTQESVLYVPLAVTVGDGFKFGCGFFLASVMAMLVGFVLIAALFALSSFMGINLPVGR